MYNLWNLEGGILGFRQRWPAVGSSRRLRRVAQLVEPSSLERSAEFASRCIIRVYKENSDDVAGVLVHPIRNQRQPILQQPGIEQVACCMAEVKSAVFAAVDLALEQTQAGIEGVGGVVELVAGDGVSGGAIAQERTVVGAKVRNVAVLAVAERRRVVAS